MIYLVVGLDHDTFASWHEHVQAVDVATAARMAVSRAEAQGIRLEVAAVIGPYSSVVSDPHGEPADRGTITVGRRSSRPRSRDVA